MNIDFKILNNLLNSILAKTNENKISWEWLNKFTIQSKYIKEKENFFIVISKKYILDANYITLNIKSDLFTQTITANQKEILNYDILNKFFTYIEKTIYKKPEIDTSYIIEMVNNL